MGVGAATLIGTGIDAHAKNKLAKSQQRLANEIHPVDTTYHESPEVRQQYALFQQLINSRGPGQAAESNIF